MIMGEMFTEESVEVKPHKWSFIFFGSPLFFLFLLFVISVVVGVFFSPVFVFSGILLVLVCFTYFLIHIVYKKEKYIITDKKVIYHYGNIFSDNSVEINLNKITQVHAILGFFQYNIFKTGNLLIKTAGASSSKIVLKNFSFTMKLYEEIQKRMQKNGFHLKKDKLVQEAKPHWLGVMGEIIGKSVGIFIFFIYFFIGYIGKGGDIGDISALGGFGSLLFTPIFLAIFVLFLVIVFKYLDLKRRKYDIYTDSVFYTEGFLSKNFSFLPMEKVADTENSQSFWSKVFGLHDVIVSSEGSNNRVIFKNMTEGEQMMKNIKYLKNNITMTQSEILSGEAEKAGENVVGFADVTEEEVLDYNKEFTDTYKMNFLKTFSSSLFFLFIALILFICIGGGAGSVFIMIAFITAMGLIVKFLFTTFIVDNSTIESKFSFLSNKHNSFSVDKITGVVVKESILDFLLKTCSITFWSIGSSSSITFANIKKTENLEKNILSKVGIDTTNKSKDIPVHFSFMNFLKANIGLVIGLSLLIILSIFFGAIFVLFGESAYSATSSTYGDSTLPPVFGIVFLLMAIIMFLFVPLLIYIFTKWYYSKRFYSQKLYEKFLFSKSGIFFRKSYFVLNKNVKGIISTKYPLTQAGKIRINVSGEQIVENKNQKTISFASNGFSMNYIANVFDIQNILDTTLQGTILEKEVLKSTKQAIGNSIVGFCIISLIIVTVISMVDIFLGIGALFICACILGFIIWSIKVKYYNLEKNRIIAARGIIYKTRQSILYKRFNFVSKNQGLLGKIFKNGEVSIYTLGSGSVDMEIEDSEDFNEIYEMLKKD